jgi:(1->4)-alpha-D-glucan 1-alpha-D-glucosylmutase
MVGGLVSQAMMSQPKFPIATYRLQFNREFTFQQAAELVHYLASLGISHCYASPYLRARPGSLHGYDIVDHNSLNPEIGSVEDYEHFVGELHRHGMGQILDIVPNHMGVMGSDNAWWLDVMENGEASAYADFFDIDWEPIKEELRGKLLVPVLEDQYGKVLEKGDLKLAFDCERGEFSLSYYQHRFPIDPREYPRILQFQLDQLQNKLGDTHEDVLELQSISTAFHNLPGRRYLAPEKKAERNREKEVQKRRLSALCSRSGEIKEFLAQNTRTLEGDKNDAKSFDSLHELIKAQVFRLAQWRVAADDINYRRFFDVNELAALRTENEAVFDATHGFVLNLVAQGKVNGLRIDHPDGLYDPAGYFDRLQSRMRRELPIPLEESKPGYVIIEKILTGNERLRPEWPVYGTTGYEFSNLVNGLFVDGTADARMERVYRTFIGHQPNFSDLVYRSKKLILKISLGSELNVLANALSRIALSDRHTCDFTLNILRSALAKIIACFPIYRTYITGEEVSQQDQRYIEQAVAAARKRGHAADTSVFDFIGGVLLLKIDDHAPDSHRRAMIRFVMKFQQVTSAVIAKGLEDTAFYRYNRLISLNEVGGNPAHFGVTVEDFHLANLERMRTFPASMLATSTHDSKRSEDVRARINVLSEMPALWRLNLRRWRDWNRSKKQVVDGLAAPTRDDEYLLYQTLIGTWPDRSFDSLDHVAWQKFTDRIEHFMLKAVREAKHFTSWTNPNAEYEAATTNFVRLLLRRRANNRFLEDIANFQRQIVRFGVFNSLSQTLLKLTSPGIPDIYQGNELWDLSMVDPDNRRPVDYERRKQMLKEVQRTQGNPDARVLHARDLFDRMEDGGIKLFLIWKTLCARKQQYELFQSGAYLPLPVSGTKASHICAFARTSGGQLAIVIVPRLLATLLGDQHTDPMDASVWGDTCVELPEEVQQAEYCEVFTGEVIRAEREGNRAWLSASSVFANFPVALLMAA